MAKHNCAPGIRRCNEFTAVYGLRYRFMKRKEFIGDISILLAPLLLTFSELYKGGKQPSSQPSEAYWRRTTYSCKYAAYFRYKVHDILGSNS